MTEQSEDINLPCWQSRVGIAPPKSVKATIIQDSGYGGVSVTVGNLEVYIEADTERGVVVRQWRDTYTGNDPDHEAAYAFADIGAVVEDKKVPSAA